jgi:mRNA interferase MazF
MDIARGDLVIVAAPGDYGKPRPALVVQSDDFLGLHSVTVLLLSSAPYDSASVRIDVQPNSGNGLRRPSQVMVDKTATVPRAKIGQRIGRLDDATQRVVDHALGRFLGLVDPADA